MEDCSPAEDDHCFLVFGETREKIHKKDKQKKMMKKFMDEMSKLCLKVESDEPNYHLYLLSYIHQYAHQDGFLNIGETAVVPYLNGRGLAEYENYGRERAARVLKFAVAGNKIKFTEQFELQNFIDTAPSAARDKTGHNATVTLESHISLKDQTIYPIFGDLQITIHNKFGHKLFPKKKLGQLISEFCSPIKEKFLNFLTSFGADRHQSKREFIHSPEYMPDPDLFEDIETLQQQMEYHLEVVKILEKSRSTIFKQLHVEQKFIQQQMRSLQIEHAKLLKKTDKKIGLTHTTSDSSQEGKRFNVLNKQIRDRELLLTQDKILHTTTNLDGRFPELERFEKISQSLLDGQKRLNKLKIDIASSQSDLAEISVDIQQKKDSLKDLRTKKNIMDHIFPIENDLYRTAKILEADVSNAKKGFRLFGKLRRKFEVILKDMKRNDILKKYRAKHTDVTSDEEMLLKLGNSMKDNLVVLKQSVGEHRDYMRSVLTQIEKDELEVSTRPKFKA